MFAPRSDLRDPCPEASTCDLAGLDWTQSWDYALTHVIEDGYGAPTGIDPDVEGDLAAELDLDAELAALVAGLAQETSAAPPTHRVDR